MACHVAIVALLTQDQKAVPAHGLPTGFGASTLGCLGLVGGAGGVAGWVAEDTAFSIVLETLSTTFFTVLVREGCIRAACNSG